MKTAFIEVSYRKNNRYINTFSKPVFVLSWEIRDKNLYFLKYCVVLTIEYYFAVRQGLVDIPVSQTTGQISTCTIIFL